jgi:hypothetical protein
MIVDSAVSEFHHLITDLAIAGEVKNAIFPAIVDVAIPLTRVEVGKNEDIWGACGRFDPALTPPPYFLCRSFLSIVSPGTRSQSAPTPPILVRSRR